MRSDGTPAGSPDPATWTDFDTAAAALQMHPRRFAGLMFALGDGWVGVDLDDVRAAGGALLPWAAALLSALATYAEVSPSGTGVKLIGRGTWAGGWHKRPHPGGGEVEVYDAGRFFTVTGHPVGDWPVAEVGDKLVGALAAAAPPEPAASVAAAPPVPADDELIRQMATARNGEKFRKLWAGDTTGYPSASEAELALCCILAWWTDGRADRADALFRRSGLMPAKWGAGCSGRWRRSDRGVAGGVRGRFGRLIHRPLTQVAEQDQDVE